MTCLQTFGMDISSYSKQIDWPQVVAQLNPRFVFARASYMKERPKANPTDPSIADPFSDACFPQYWQALGQYKIPRGAYVFCHPWADPGATTDQFFKDYTPVPGDLLPTLDIEDIWDSDSGVAQNQRVAFIQTMVDNVAKRICGQMPMIYTKTRVWNDLGDPKQFAKCPLWILNYQTLPTTENMPTATWPTFAFWQYAENLVLDKVIGGDYDPNLFNGSEAELKNYVIQKVTA
jgi:GH25 family lysozyme M1 (1,4-beta-N-acetylmuramidase)